MRQSGNAPLRRLRRQLPLQGSLSKRQPPAKPPLQGEVDAPPGADGGVRHIALPVFFRGGIPSRLAGQKAGGILPDAAGRRA